MLDLAKNIFLRAVAFSNENAFPKQTNSKKLLNADIVIMTATPQEFDSIKSGLNNLKEIEFGANDSDIYYKAELLGLNKLFSIVLPYPNGIGIEAAVNCTSKAISLFSPALVIMCGICAGNKNVTEIGDLIIAEKTINYGNVVEIEKEGTVSKKKFMQTADSINKNLKARLTLFSTSQTFQKVIESIDLPHNLKRVPICQLGLMVTGSTLLRSNEKMTDINDSYHGVKAMDMESHGVYYASSNSNKDRNPLYFSMKAVSDFGDSTNHKISSIQRNELALQISAKSTIGFIKEHYKQ